jgi:predicted AlkP superfamily pyrophosphatase or phosphodiesterase
MSRPRRAFLVVCDALQRHYINQSNTPTLAALHEQATEFSAVTGVFPSMTRVTSASIATGCLPGTHGLVGNSMALDEGRGLVSLSVGAPDFVERMRRATGTTLKRKTLAERLTDHGGSVVYSNVSAGAAHFQDPDGFGYVYHRSGSFGPGRRPVAKSDHLDVTVGIKGDAQMTERFCRQVIPAGGPALGVLWLSEPDWSAHGSALGSPDHIAGLQAADQCVARVLAAMTEHGLDEETLLIVCSDHGMQTIREELDLTECLVRAGLKKDTHSHEVVVAPNGTAALIYVAAGDGGKVQMIADFLRTQPWLGRLWIGHALTELGLSATGGLAMAVASKERDDVNEFGVRGSSVLFQDPFDSKCYVGRGMHGGMSESEQSPFLLLRGGLFGAGRRRSSAASPIDIAPTVLAHLGLSREGCEGVPLLPG